MDHVNTQLNSFTKVSKSFFTGFILVYVAFIVDILLFQIKVWALEGLPSDEIKIKRSIFVVQTFRYEESISSTVILFGPSEIGYLSLFALPLVSAVIISLSIREKSTDIQSNNSKLMKFSIFFIMIDGIIIILLELKLNYFDNNFSDFIWIDTLDVVLSITLLIILTVIFGSIVLIGKIKLSRNPIMIISFILALFVVLLFIAVFMYVLASIANARIA